MKKLSHIGKKRVKIKAWAVTDVNGIVRADILERDADCACRAMIYHGAAIFGKKAEAESFCNAFDDVREVKITYSLPKVNKNNK